MTTTGVPSRVNRSSLHTHQPMGDKNFHNKPLPASNDKYSHISGMLKTGKTVNDVKPKSYDASDEIHKRVGPNTLYELVSAHLTQVESVDQLQSTAALERPNTDFQRSAASNTMSMTQTMTNSLISPQDEYFLLDCRDPELYAQCHILTSISLPIANIRQDRFSNELYSFKSAVGKHVIIYDAEDELLLAREGGRLLVQKGFDSVYVLTGGLKRFALKFNFLVEGTNTLQYTQPPVGPRLPTSALRKLATASGSATASGRSTKTPLTATASRLKTGVRV